VVYQYEPPVCLNRQLQLAPRCFLHRARSLTFISHRHDPMRGPDSDARGPQGQQGCVLPRHGAGL